MGALIVIAGGGTGGHVFPALAVAGELRRRDASREMLFLGAVGGIETRLVPAAGFALRTLRLGGIAGKSLVARVRSLVQASAATLRCAAMFLRRRPALVMGVGGFASGPAVLAALAIRVPTLIQEQNAEPGLTNRWLGRFVDRVALSLPGSEARFGSRAFVAGNPIRPEFFRIPPYAGPSDRLRILVFGGSRGARTLTRATVSALDHLADVAGRISIVLQTGEAEHAGAARACEGKGFDIEVLPFIDDMPARLTAADLVVCRSGAGTVFELAAAGRASVLVPFPFSAGGHQEKNADWLAREGAAAVVSDAEMTGSRLAGTVREALAAPASLTARAEAARRLARPRAAEEIADAAESLMGGRRP